MNSKVLSLHEFKQDSINVFLQIKQVLCLNLKLLFQGANQLEDASYLLIRSQNLHNLLCTYQILLAPLSFVEVSIGKADVLMSVMTHQSLYVVDHICFLLHH